MGIFLGRGHGVGPALSSVVKGGKLKKSRRRVGKVNTLLAFFDPFCGDRRIPLFQASEQLTIGSAVGAHRVLAGARDLRKT